MSSPAERALRARIDDLRRGGRDRVAYLPPNEEEAASYARWLRTVALAARDGTAPPTEAPPGFRVEVLPAAPDFLIISEQDGARRGAGVVVLRRGPARAVLVEAPHTFFDQGTLPLAVIGFAEHAARGLVVNTVHRFRGPEALSDVAHADASFFLLAHEVLLEAFPAILCIQLHGFSDERAPGASVILSAAGSSATPPTAGVAAAIGGGVRVFPDDIGDLGGTTNVQGGASRRAGAPFMHVEIARSLRDRLASDDALARRLVAALLDRGVRGGDT